METKNKITIELELAWLVKKLPADLDRCLAIEILQAYLKHNDPKIKDVRIRKKGNDFTQTTKYFVKSSQETGYTREETNKLSAQEFNRLWPKAAKKTRKRRYFYPLASGLTAEIDVYQDNLKGLVVVEVEFSSVESYRKFIKPAWFGKEVTDSVGIYPPVMAEMNIEEVSKINREYRQRPHRFE